MSKFWKCTIFPLLLWGLVGCAPRELPDYLKEVQPLHELYNDGLDRLLEGSYNQSIEKFKLVDQHYPHTVWAKRVRLLRAYAHYQLGDCVAVSAQVIAYTQLYPADSRNPYAYYLEGRCYYDDMLLPGRDSFWTEKAEEKFLVLVTAYPDSIYAVDAQEKLYFVRSRLAGTELGVGRFYQKKRNYPAAIGRYKGLIDKYENTLYVEEALHRLVESYLSMGLNQEALKTGALLGANFPNSDWYQKSYDLLKERDLLSAEG